jgi:hypothetical protein
VDSTVDSCRRLAPTMGCNKDRACGFALRANLTASRPARSLSCPCFVIEILREGGRFYSALIDSSNTEQNIPPLPPCERTWLAPEGHRRTRLTYGDEGCNVSARLAPGGLGLTSKPGPRRSQSRPHGESRGVGDSRHELPAKFAVELRRCLRLPKSRGRLGQPDAAPGCAVNR